jgi:hypothetical protein
MQESNKTQAANSANHACTTIPPLSHTEIMRQPMVAQQPHSSFLAYIRHAACSDCCSFLALITLLIQRWSGMFF